MPVLSTLGRERIVRTVDGAGSNGARYEIFHDVLGEAVLAWRREQELERERRAAERRHRRLAIVAVAALLALAAMTAVAIYALSQRREARRAADTAHARELVARSSSLVARSSALLAQDPLESVGLAAQAARLDPTAAAETALRDSLAASRERTILKAGNGRVNAAAYDPSSTLVVTADGDGTARIFSTLGEQVAVLRQRGAVTDAAFSPDGKIVATASRDRTVKLWNRDGGLIRTLRHDSPVVDLVFSPDRRVLVTTTAAGTTHIWSLGPDRAHRTLATPAPAHAVISNDGQYLAVVGADRFARVYSLPSGALIFELPHSSQVLSAAFGPRKEMLVTGSADWTAQTWDLRRGQPGVPAERALRARGRRGGQSAGPVRRNRERRRHGAYLERRHPTGRAHRDRHGSHGSAAQHLVQPQRPLLRHVESRRHSARLEDRSRNSGRRSRRARRRRPRRIVQPDRASCTHLRRGRNGTDLGFRHRCRAARPRSAAGPVHRSRRVRRRPAVRDDRR